MGDEGDRGDRREGMELGEEDKGDWRGRHGTGQDRMGGTGWDGGETGTGRESSKVPARAAVPQREEFCRGTGTGMGQERREGMGWRGEDEDRDGTAKKGWDREDRTHWGTVQSPPASCPRTSPAHTGPRAPAEGLGRSWGRCGAGRDRGCCGDPGRGLWPLCGALCLSQWWLSGDPQPRDPRSGHSWVPLSPAPRWRSRAGCSPPVPGGCTAPHTPCSHPRSHAYTCLHACRHVHGASALGRRAGDRGPQVSPAGDTPLCPRSAGGGPRRPCSSSSPNTLPQVRGAGTGTGWGWDTGQGWMWWQGTWSRDGRWWQGWNMVSLIRWGGRDGMRWQGWDTVSCMVWDAHDGTWWQGWDTVVGWDAVSCTVWDVRSGTWWQRWDTVAGMGHGGRDGMQCHLWYGICGMGRAGREGTGCHIQDGVAGTEHGGGTGHGGSSLAGRVTPWSGGPGVGRDLPGSVGCRQPPSRSPFSPRRCQPRGRVPALPGEWVPGPPGQAHSPVPRLPQCRGGVIGAQPRCLPPRPGLAPALIGSLPGTAPALRGRGHGAKTGCGVWPQRKPPRDHHGDATPGSPTPDPRGGVLVLGEGSAMGPHCGTPIAASSSRGPHRETPPPPRHSTHLPMGCQGPPGLR